MQEPPTHGKVSLKTTVGDIDIELWSRECPKACRNFVQLCLEGYYNNTLFHRVVKDFLVQGGDPDGDGTGGESIYGQAFNDEFHSRLRFNRRGLVGMATSEKDSNKSQFFFSFGATPELQGKNTLFGRIVGDTIYNMLKLQECEVDHNERPMYPHKIIASNVIVNPFNDIVPRKLVIREQDNKQDKKNEISVKGVRNFCLLSFGEEAEVDEIETSIFTLKNAGKAKSMHDAIDDPKLSKQTVQVDEINSKSFLTEENESNYIINEIRKRLQCPKDNAKIISKQKLEKTKEIMEENNDNATDDGISDEDCLKMVDEEKRIEHAKKRDEIRQEIQSLKKEYQINKQKKEIALGTSSSSKNKNDSVFLKESAVKNEYIKEYLDDKIKYRNLKSQIPLKGSSREEFTLNLLSKFRAKLSDLKAKSLESQNNDQENDDENRKLNTSDDDEEQIEKDIQTDAWLCHTFRQNGKSQPIVAKDASTKDDDWYDIYDPRHPINKRKRKNVPIRSVTEKHHCI